MDKNSIGLIGFGEVAYVFAKELTQKGITVYVYDHRFLEDSPKGRKKREKAEEIGVQQMHSVEQLVGCTPVILSTVVPAAAYDVAKAASAIVDERHMFIDMNSVNPKVKQEMADLFPDGSLFLDGVIMGAPKIRGLETLIYYSGRCPLTDLNERSPALQHFHLRHVGPKIGDASAIKMCQSIFSKGLQSLIIEQILLTTKLGIHDIVEENLNRILGSRSYTDWVEYALRSNLMHAKRRSDELQNAVELLSMEGLPARHSRAAQETLKWLAELNMQEMTENDSIPIQDLIRAILDRYK